jgi:hypothetical protein
VTGNRRVFVLALRRDGDAWRGRILDNPAAEVTAGSREAVMRELEAQALAQVVHDLRAPDAAVVKEVVFELTEE